MHFFIIYSYLVHIFMKSQYKFTSGQSHEEKNFGCITLLFQYGLSSVKFTLLELLNC
jgi:hypothetical protein